MNFVPFKFNENRHILNDADIDSDVNFYNNISINCKYYIDNDFQNLVSKDNQNNLSLICINNRSLKCNLKNILNSLHSLNYNFDVIAITETWLSSDQHDLVNIVGYTSNFISREGGGGGGVGLYIKDGIKYKLKSNLSVSKNNVESIFLELENDKKNVIIGCVYNPPDNDLEIVNEYLSEILNKVSSKPSYICGDFNVNLFNHDKHIQSGKFLDLFTSEGFYPLITHPSRITKTSSTLIDNIFTNILDKSISSGLMISDISDHLPVFQISHNSDISVSNVKNYAVIVKRIINVVNIEQI